MNLRGIALAVLISVTSAAADASQPSPVKLFSAGLTRGAGFGHAVAISGTTAVVGAWQQDLGARTQGAAYVYVRQGESWLEQATLVAADGALRDYFGQSVAIDTDTIAVGVPQADVAGNRDQGAVYVFTRTGGAWTQQAKLTASGGAPADVFGHRVALSGDTLLIGSPGADANTADKARSANGIVHVFSRSNQVWTETQRLSGDNTATTSFGANVAIDQGTAVIQSGDAGGSEAVYVFANAGAGWKQTAKLVSRRDAADRFTVNMVTRNLAISGTTFMVGGPRAGSGSDGAVYVYGLNAGAWTRQAVLSPAAGSRGDSFGWSVDIDGDIAVIGAFGANQLRGTAYLFQRDRTPAGTSWVERRVLTDAQGQIGDTFGTDVAISGTGVIVGAPNSDRTPPNTNEGAAYVVSGGPGV